jgi:predicted metal-dependent phosphotriesterase family hydrolase
MELTRKDKINIVLKLHRTHSNGTSLPNEYTTAKWDFLASEGLISSQVSKTSFDKAKLQYQYELENIIQTGGIVDSHIAQEFIEKLRQNDLTENQIAYLTKKAKREMLKEYFDSVTKIIFKDSE